MMSYFLCDLKRKKVCKKRKKQVEKRESIFFINFSIPLWCGLDVSILNFSILIFYCYDFCLRIFCSV